MTLEQANHVITAVVNMLNDLVTQGVIGHAQKDVLIPVMVKIVLKNESVTVDSV